jgi:ribose transport system substrate-binding protein
MSRRPVRTTALAGALLLTAALAGCSSGGGSAATAEGEGPAWCGTQPMVFGMQDGGGLNAWSQASAAEVMKVVDQCPNITQTLRVDAQFDLQKAISGLQGMVAQGAKAVVIIPDAGGSGAAELPGMRTATARGVAVVPWAADPGGDAGTDYLTYVDSDHVNDGRNWAEWMVSQLPDGGNVAFVGGPAGNQVSADELQGITDVLADHPDITLITGDDTWADGGWDPATSQQAMAALLSQNPQIDGVFGDEGIAQTGIVKAFQSAGRPLVPLAGLEANALACLYEQLAPTEPGFALATSSARNWTGRIAAQLAIAKAAGVEISADDALSTDPVVQLPLYEDSVAGGDQAPHCDSSAAPDALLSNDMTDDQVRALTSGSGE